VLALIGLTMLAAAIRFWRIGHQGFWFDEGNTALLVHFSPGTMLRQLARTESTPPLYYCLAWVWSRVFGHGEVPLRSLSALAGTVTVPVAYVAGVKLISRRAAFLAAALTACNPLLIWYSQEARSYALLVLLSGVALAAFASAREDPTPRRLGAWAAASALALGTHYYAVLAIVPQAVWLLKDGHRRRPVRLAVGLVGLCGVALIPLAIVQGSRGLTSWIAHAPLGRRVAEVWPQFVLGFGSPGWGVLKWVALAGAVLGLVLLLTRAGPRERAGGVLVAGFALAGLMLNLLLIAGGLDDLITRNLLATWMPAALAVAAGLAAPRARWAGGLAALVMCASGIVAAVGVSMNRNLERPDWRVVARILGARPVATAAGASARAIFVQHYRELLPLSLYLPGLKAVKHGAVTVSEIDVVSFTSPPSNDFCWWGSACNLWPSVAQRTYPIRGFRELWRRRALQFTVVRLVSSRPVSLTPHAMARALKTTRYVNDELLVQR
jgi:hypothetical protein